MGILLWCAAASITAFAAFAVRGRGTGGQFEFLLYSSLLSVYLVLDDCLRFHEGLEGRFGVDEKVTCALLGIAVIAYLVMFREIILTTRWQMLAAALLLLATSLVVDQAASLLIAGGVPGWGLMEDGFKLLGIAAWLSYMVTAAYRLMTSALWPGSGATRTL